MQFSRLDEHPMSKDKQMSFEEALSKLEEIVDRLEKGEVSLDDAVKAYEEGSMLKNECQKRLDEARLKVERIRSKRGSGKAEGTEPFDQDAS